MAKQSKFNGIKNKYNPFDDINSIKIENIQNTEDIEKENELDNDIILSPQEIKNVKNGATVKIVKNNNGGKQQMSILINTQIIEDIHNLIFIKNAQNGKNTTFTSIVNELLSNYVAQHQDEIDMVKKFKSKF